MCIRVNVLTCMCLLCGVSMCILHNCYVGFMQSCLILVCLSEWRERESKRREIWRGREGGRDREVEREGGGGRDREV